MSRHGSVTEKQRELFEGEFFGKLRIEITCNQFTTYFDGESETHNYETVLVEGDRITTRYYDRFKQQTVENTVVLEGDCYSVPLEGLGFREYFCRVE